jgi:hypothetical protein
VTIRDCHADLHDRYILTDVGGYKFGQGLDEAGQTDQQCVHVLLLDFATSQQLLMQHIGPNPPFTRDPPDIIFPEDEAEPWWEMG